MTHMGNWTPLESNQRYHRPIGIVDEIKKSHLLLLSWLLICYKITINFSDRKTYNEIIQKTEL